jgi:hypothetical protein
VISFSIRQPMTRASVGENSMFMKASNSVAVVLG